MTAAAEWCLRLGAALTGTADGIGALAARVARDWPDAEGELRADRLTMVHRSLLRTADDAAALGTRLQRAEAAMTPAGDLAALLARLASIGSALGGQAQQHGGGVRLGDVGGERVAGEPGMRLPDTSADGS